MTIRFSPQKDGYFRRTAYVKRVYSFKMFSANSFKMRFIFTSDKLSLSECIPWMTVGLVESIAIITLNLCTIIVFIKNPDLRVRSTYLLINLAVIDMLAGGFVTYGLFYLVGGYCEVWNTHLTEGWAYNIPGIFSEFFPISSLSNITLIALERLHATYRPFMHRVLKTSVYRIIIAVVWITASLLAIGHALFVQYGEYSIRYFLLISFTGLCLLIIFVSYVSIVIKVRYGAQPQHHGAASRERKLTMTLLIVTVVSLLLYLPFVILRSIFSSELTKELSFSEYFHLFHVMLAFYYANHLVNPVLYAIRKPEYRSAVLALFRKRPPRQGRVEDLPLQDSHGNNGKEQHKVIGN